MELARASLPHTIGIHPHYITDGKHPQYIEDIWSRIDKNMVMAVGEIGLDCTSEFTMDLQKNWFSTQISFAIAKNLPVVIHCRGRNAIVSMLKILKKYPAITGVWHAFTGTFDDYMKLPKGILVGVNTLVTYVERYQGPRILKVVLQIPLQRLLFQTDYPWLKPEFLKVNDIRITLPYLYHYYAMRRGVKLDKLMRVIASNFIRTFPRYPVQNS